MKTANFNDSQAILYMYIHETLKQRCLSGCHSRSNFLKASKGL